MRTHFRTCHLCEAMCGVAIDVEGDTITSIRGDRDDPFSRGHVCPKALGLKDVHEDPDRLRLPQRRVGEHWETVPWDEAFDEVAERLSAVAREHGKDAVAFYQGNPTVHNYGSMIGGQLLSRALGSRSRYSATSVDQLPHMLAALEMFGHQLLLPVPDLDRTDFLLVLGANPLASNGSLMTAPDVAKRLAAIRTRGGSIVVVDPRRTETAEIADRHVFVRPGGDAALLLSMMHAIFAERLERPGRLADFTDRMDVLRREVAAFSPDRVGPAIGVAAETIREVARAFAKSPRAACYGRIGICTQEFGGEYPASALSEEIETPGKGQIRALVTSCGNPVLSTPNGKRLEAALPKLDFMVSIDLYRNETTRHANLILPPTFALEHDHYDLAFHALAIRNTTRYSEPLFAKPAGARHDWEIFLELATRLDARKGLRAGIAARAARAAFLRLGPEAVLEAGLRTGPYGSGLLPGGLTLKKVRAAPHGLDLGPLTPCLPERLHTKTGRIDVAPALFVADLPRLAAWITAETGEPERLSLIGRRDLRSNNSWMHNSRRLVKGPVRCTLLMHPDDATRRGLTDSSDVVVRSRVGSVTVPLEVSDVMMPGVVSLPHGWGHDRPGTKLGVAQERPGASANDLTDEAAIDPLSGNARLNGVPVDVERARAPGE